MHPDNRYLTIKDAINRLLSQRGQSLLFWPEQLYIAVGMGPRDVQPLITVHSGDSSTLTVAFHIDSEAMFHRLKSILSPEISVETPEKFPGAIQIELTVDEAPRIIERALDKVYEKGDIYDIVWYGTENSPVSPTPIYTMGCLTLWLFLVGLSFALSLFFIFT